MKNQTKNLYAFHALNTGQCVLGEDYSFLHTRLGHIANLVDTNKLSLENFAEEALKALNSSKLFPSCDRVCLSLMQPQSRTLKVCSSANTDNLKQNIMQENYWCLVREESSIIGTAPTDIRIYSDIEDIIANYSNAKVQRSLRYLREMGVKSGLAIPLTEFGLHTGLLFLNSTKKGAYDELKPEDYATLCLLKIISTNIFVKKNSGHSIHDKSYMKVIKNLKTPNIFNVQNFSETLQQLFSFRFDNYFNLNVSIPHQELPELLFNGLSLCYLITQTVEANLLKTQKEIYISVHFKKNNEQGDQLIVECEGISLGENDLKLIDHMSFLPSQKISRDGNKIIFSNKVDPVVDGLDYSV